MTVALRRGQIGRVKGGKLLDITVKSASGWALSFAPTWEMVTGHKGGTIGDLEYRNRYEAILDAAGEEAFRKLWEFGADGQVRLLCYCPDGRFCHTHLMIDYAVKRFPQWFSDDRHRARSAPKKEKVRRMKYLLAVDLETTGLRPGYHEITQIAAIMLDSKLDELGAFETLVRIDNPERGLENNFNVFEYTGLKLEDIQRGMPKRDALRALETFARSKIGGTDLRQILMFGQNPTFDKGFLDAAFEQQGWKFPFDFHVVALESIYVHHHLLRTGELPADIALKDICKVAGVENKQKHNAMSDIRATVDALHRLCPRAAPLAKRARTQELSQEIETELETYEAGIAESELENDPGPAPAPVPRRRNVGRK